MTKMPEYVLFSDPQLRVEVKFEVNLATKKIEFRVNVGSHYIAYRPINEMTVSGLASFFKDPWVACGLEKPVEEKEDCDGYLIFVYSNKSVEDDECLGAYYRETREDADALGADFTVDGSTYVTINPVTIRGEEVPE